jgi:F0F1-type ATP synthase, subunit b
MSIGVIPNETLFVEIVLFLVFVAVVNYMVLKPYLGIAKERQDQADKTLKEAQALAKEREMLLKEAQEILEKAKKEAQQILEEAIKKQTMRNKEY